MKSPRTSNLTSWGLACLVLAEAPDAPLLTGDRLTGASVHRGKVKVG